MQLCNQSLFHIDAGLGTETCLQKGKLIEEVAFSDAWCDVETKRTHSLTSILSCIASLDERGAGADQGSEAEFSEAVEEELRRIVLLEHRQRSCATASEDCALTTGLFLLLRMQGNMQVCAPALTQNKGSFHCRALSSIIYQKDTYSGV